MFDKKELLKVSGDGLLLHHWDTDGICSASILLQCLKNKKLVNRTPLLGNYFLTEHEIKEYSDYAYILIVDMALPEEDISKLAKKAQVFIFDHHLQKPINSVHHLNPIILGKSAELYPSTSWIVNTFLENEVNLFSILGVVGDHEQKIQENEKIYPYIEQYCSEYKLSFNDLLTMVYRIDSCYKIGNKKQVEKAPYILLEYTTGDMILKNRQWKKNLMLLETEIEYWAQQPGRRMGDVVIKKIETSYNIISTVTRKIAWATGNNVVVVNTGFFKDFDQIYVRSNKNVEPLIAQGKNLGFKTGGKAEVLGAIVPKDKTESFIQKILVFLSDETTEVQR